ncbi:MAG: zf-TFIIB domain-containing protein [Bacteroidales bacterium]|nr:zf-TFIIB domain-containing protein [Bacteroidales bacterium]
MKSPVSNEPMLVLELAGVEIDYCPLTHGIWLDAGELEALFDDRETADQFLASFRPDKDCREKKVRCPICYRKMEKVLTAGGVVIDSCQQKHGLWFDEGELIQVLKAGHEGAESRVADLLKNMFLDHLKK